MNSIRKCGSSVFLRNRSRKACALALGAACAVLGALHFGPVAHATNITWGTASPATETYLNAGGGQSHGLSGYSPISLHPRGTAAVD